MHKKLIIVESPGKIKTIRKYLDSSYIILSSNGHIRDLPQKKLGIDIEQHFEPTYVIDEKKKQQIALLKKAINEVSFVILASDDDREGEAIAWHIQQALKIPEGKYTRIVFQSITKTAIQKALQQPRQLDQARINAQQARRVLDRLVGYLVSPLLWKFLQSGLSAGRVQSVAVRLIVEREREILHFTPTEKGQVKATFLLPGDQVLHASVQEDFSDYLTAKDFVQKCLKASFHIQDIQKKEVKRTPAPPLMTSTLQQAALQELSFSIDKTTLLAQKLYEKGRVTYIRTDSLHLADEALKEAQKVITKNYGEDYHKKRVYKTKSTSAQEAHEAIRPTSFVTVVVSEDRDEQRLYTLIRNRALASQMADARINKTKATIGVSSVDTRMVAEGELVVFPGFLTVFQREQTDKRLPELKKGTKLSLQEMTARQNFTKPPARYNEGTLVKQLEALGIGRPSTYRPIISTIQQRGYVEKKSREGTKRAYKYLVLKNDTLEESQQTEETGSIKERLLPTSVGMLVNDFLMNHFVDIMSYTFTAKTEEKLDAISQNKLAWRTMIKDFYTPFIERIDLAKSQKNDGDSLAKVRHLGADPATGKPIYARLSRRYGPMIQLGDFDQEEKPRFASLLKDQLLEEVTLESALKLFQMPREVGIYQGEKIMAHLGRYGPYLKYKEISASLGAHDPFTVTAEVAIFLIEEKIKNSRPLKTFPENPKIEIRKGRFGIYIKTPSLNVRIPKDRDVTSLSLADCEVLIEEAAKKKKSFSRTKK